MLFIDQNMGSQFVSFLKLCNFPFTMYNNICQYEKWYSAVISKLHIQLECQIQRSHMLCLTLHDYKPGRTISSSRAKCRRDREKLPKNLILLFLDGRPGPWHR